MDDAPNSNVVKVRAEVHHLEGMMHVAHVGGRDFISDEPVSMGGTDNAPYPLDYFVAGVGMCLVTQVVWLSNQRKIALKDVSCDVTIEWSRSGSVLRGTIETICHGMKAELRIESEENQSTLEEIARTAEASCYAHTAVVNGSSLGTTFLINGERFEVS